MQLLSQTSIDLREAQGTCMLGRKNPLTLENQVASVERGRVWAVKTCSSLGISGQHSPLEVQHNSSELETTWGFEEKTQW